MADKKISELTPATSLTGEEELPATQSGGNVKLLISQLKAFFLSAMSGITGPIESPTYIQFGDGSATPLAAGRVWFNEVDGSLNAGMGGGNITQQIGEELFKRGKATAAISDTNLQLIYKTGTVGASGVVSFAPAVAGITNESLIIGVATESIVSNGFGRVTTFGTVHGVNTSGAPYGETWADDDTIWYNPVTGGLTNVKPIAPNVKTQIGTVLNAGGGGSGSFDVEIIHGSTLGGTDANVEFTTLANDDYIVYNAATQRWENKPRATSDNIAKLCLMGA